MSYKVVTTAKHATGNQYGQIRQHSKMTTRRAISTPTGELLCEGCFDKKRAWDMAVDFLSHGGDESRLNVIDFDMLADHAVIGVNRKFQRAAIEIAARELVAR